MNDKTISIRQFRKFIRALPVDKNDLYTRQDKYNRTQHQHWNDWLGGYNGPGAYNRKN